MYDKKAKWETLVISTVFAVVDAGSSSGRLCSDGAHLAVMGSLIG